MSNVPGFRTERVKSEAELGSGAADRGYCADAEPLCKDAGDFVNECNDNYCISGLASSGSWPLSEAEVRNWRATRTACVSRCERCAACRYVSFSRRLRDCSWYAACSVGSLRQTIPGFFTTMVRASTLVRVAPRRDELPGPIGMLRTIQPLLSPNRAPPGWWEAARPGRCSIAGVAASPDVTAAPDCRLASSGSWSLREDARGWKMLDRGHFRQELANACLARCVSCENCRFISWSAQTLRCTFYSHCDLDALRTFGEDADDVLSMAVRSHFTASMLRFPHKPFLPPSPRTSVGRGAASNTTSAADGDQLDVPCAFEYDGPCGRWQRPSAGAAHSEERQGELERARRTCNRAFVPTPCAHSVQRVRALSKAAEAVRRGGLRFFADARARRDASQSPLNAKQRLGVQKAHSRELFSPRHRLVFCPIEKVTSTAWIKIISLAATGRPMSYRETNEARGRGTLPALNALPIEQQLHAIHCDDFVKVVVVRDPLERLLSAYLDKCHHTPHGPGHIQQHCTKLQKEGRVPRFDEVVSNLAARADAGEDLCGENQHFAPQVCFCGLSDSRNTGAGAVARYQHVLHMSSATFVEDAHSLLRLLGLGRIASMYLPKFTAGSGHRTNTSRHIEEYFTPTTVRAALRAFRRDYETFSMPRPAWARRIVGENYWFTSK